MEIVGGRWNVIIGIGLEFPWAVGYIALPGIAYHIPDWGHLQLAISGEQKTVQRMIQTF